MPFTLLKHQVKFSSKDEMFLVQKKLNFLFLHTQQNKDSSIIVSTNYRILANLLNKLIKEVRKAIITKNLGAAIDKESRKQLKNLCH